MSSARIADRESGYIRASIELLDSQEKLAAQLDRLQKQIESIQTPSTGSLRIIA